MKTLVIHPKDITTDFLKEIYCDMECTVLNQFKSKKEIKKAIKEHDRIIMLGHGTEYGLLGQKRYIIDSTLVYLLRGKILIGIWCNANMFFNKYFYSFDCTLCTGMIISEYYEALEYNLHKTENISSKIEESNILLSTVLKKNIPLITKNTDLIRLKLDIYHEYKSNDNPIINFNRKNIY